MKQKCWESIGSDQHFRKVADKNHAKKVFCDQCERIRYVGERGQGEEEKRERERDTK